VELPGSGAVREDEDGVQVTIVRGRVKRGGDGGFGISWKLEGEGTHTRSI
jgi:hypothetical protein